MDFTSDPTNEQFRITVREYLAAHLPSDLAWRGQQGYLSDRGDSLRWTQIKCLRRSLTANGTPVVV